MEIITATEQRIRVHQKGEEAGPVIIVVGGMHGNEEQGIAALQQMGEIFARSGGIVRGEWIGVAANMSALNRKVRYVDEDMNRIWFPELIDEIRNTPKDRLLSSERREMKDLLEILDSYLLHDSREVILVDLHSFSAPGSPFLITPRDAGNPELAGGLNVPLVFGIDDVLQGAAIRFVQGAGKKAIAFEGGAHHAAGTCANMVSFLLLLSARFGMIDPSAVHEYGEYRERLAARSNGLPGKVELVYRHLIEPGAGFAMRPGFENFQPVQQGDRVADDGNGPVYSPSGGFMLLPLYQSQGDDGFFIVKEVG